MKMLPRIVPVLACLLLLAGLPTDARAQQPGTTAPTASPMASPQEANGQTFRSDLEAYRLLPQERAAAARKRSQQTLALIAIAGSAAAVAAIGAGSASVPLAVAGSVFIVYLSMP